MDESYIHQNERDKPVQSASFRCASTLQSATRVNKRDPNLLLNKSCPSLSRNRNGSF